MTLGLLALLVVALLAVAGPALAARRRDQHPVRRHDRLQELDWPAQHYPLDSPVSTLAAGASLHDGRAPDLTLTLYDNTPGHQGPYDVPFWKEFSGAHSDIYVGWDDLASAPDVRAAGPGHHAGPGRVRRLRSSTRRIWESDVFHFGNYVSRTPDQSLIDGKRAAIFVHNIRDDAYWTSYRFYIAGYFSSGLNDDLQAQRDLRRLVQLEGPSGRQHEQPSLSYLYEGTVAHEFQHLIHHDVDPDEADFINEGMAEIAVQFLYGAKGDRRPRSARRSTITATHSSTGRASCSTTATPACGRTTCGSAPAARPRRPARRPRRFGLRERQVRGDRRQVRRRRRQVRLEPDPRREGGLDAVADQVGGRDEVEGLFRDWTLANLLDGKVTEANWNYSNLVLNGADSDDVTVDQGIAFYQSNVNGNMPPTRKNVRRNTATEPWGAYYRTYGGSEPGFTM